MKKNGEEEEEEEEEYKEKMMTKEKKTKKKKKKKKEKKKKKREEEVEEEEEVKECEWIGDRHGQPRGPLATGHCAAATFCFSVLRTTRNLKILAPNAKLAAGAQRICTACTRHGCARAAAAAAR